MSLLVAFTLSLVGVLAFGNWSQSWLPPGEGVDLDESRTWVGYEDQALVVRVTVENEPDTLEFVDFHAVPEDAFSFDAKTRDLSFTDDALVPDDWQVAILVENVETGEMTAHLMTKHGSLVEVVTTGDEHVPPFTVVATPRFVTWELLESSPCSMRYGEGGDAVPAEAPFTARAQPDDSFRIAFPDDEEGTPCPRFAFKVENLGLWDHPSR